VPWNRADEAKPPRPRATRGLEIRPFSLAERKYVSPSLEPHEIEHLVGAWRDLHKALATSAAKKATRTPEEARGFSPTSRSARETTSSRSQSMSTLVPDIWNDAPLAQKVKGVDRS